MSDGEKGVLFLLGCAALASVPVHLRVKQFVFASALSGTMASIVFAIVDTAIRGYADPFRPVSLVIGAVWGTVMSACVGGVVRILYHARAEPAVLSPPPAAPLDHPRSRQGEE